MQLLLSAWGTCGLDQMLAAIWLRAAPRRVPHGLLRCVPITDQVLLITKLIYSSWSFL